MKLKRGPIHIIVFLALSLLVLGDYFLLRGEEIFHSALTPGRKPLLIPLTDIEDSHLLELHTSSQARLAWRMKDPQQKWMDLSGDPQHFKGIRRYLFLPKIRGNYHLFVWRRKNSQPFEGPVKVRILRKDHRLFLPLYEILNI